MSGRGKSQRKPEEGWGVKWEKGWQGKTSQPREDSGEEGGTGPGLPWSVRDKACIGGLGPRCPWRDGGWTGLGARLIGVSSTEGRRFFF